MKKLLLVLIIGLAVYVGKEKGPALYKELTFEAPKIGMGVITESEKSVRIEHLVSKKTKLSDLAQPGAVTIIFLSSNSCSSCSSIRNKINKLKAFRSDIIVHTIKHLYVPQKFSSKKEKAEFNQRVAQINSALNIGGFGHIEIYNPDKKLLAGGKGSNVGGLEYLNRWLEHEK